VKALFEIDFRKFITPSIIKIVHILIMVMLIVCYLFFVVAVSASVEPSASWS